LGTLKEVRFIDKAKMENISNILRRSSLIFRKTLSFSWYIFWILFAIIMAPFQRKYHKSIANKKPESSYGQVRAHIDFRKAINLIEEYKLKFGVYPENLKDPKFQELINKKR
jgi:hypothetical protein